MRDSAPSIAIVGGGIGGLAAALSMLRLGLDAHVYEQASSLGEVGAGIQISPNASRILHGFGLGPALAEVAVKPVAAHVRRWDDGRTLVRSALSPDVEAAFGAPYYHLHRADLLQVLSKALPPERVHLGFKLVALAERGDAVEARFGNGESVRADVLVGADGIHSSVRSALFGPEAPQFTGCIAYRGLVPADRLAHLGLETTANNWMGPQHHFVHYFVSARRLVNFVAVAERDSWTRESWTDRGSIADALAVFAGWHDQVREIIAAADETYIWALFDRAPLARWSAGHATLLGDSCHAMLPFMAQGAAQAIEDGATLAACLAQSAKDDLPAALRRYESLRLARATRLQQLSRANKTRFHLPDGPAQRERDASFANGWDRSIPAVGWLYAHDARVVEPGV